MMKLHKYFLDYGRKYFATVDEDGGHYTVIDDLDAKGNRQVLCCICHVAPVNVPRTARCMHEVFLIQNYKHGGDVRP